MNWTSVPEVGLGFFFFFLLTSEPIANLCAVADDKNSSSSYKALTTRFKIQYADGSGAQGIYMTDDFTIGGATLSQLEMGLGEEATINSGLIGLGYDTNEAASRVYPNILDVFQSQGLIGTKAYSLYLVGFLHSAMV
jgi:hypothetical protein